MAESTDTAVFIRNLSGLRHDLNAPLANIKGFTTILGTLDDTEKRKRYLEIILQECERAVVRNNELVEMARTLMETENNTGEPNPPLTVSIRRMPGSEDLPLPHYETKHAAGMDIRANLAAPVILAPGERAAIPTGLQVALPIGYEAQIRPRSGLAVRSGIGLVNTPGTIDADFRGEIQIIVINHGSEPFTIERGDRIAQMIVAPIVQIEWYPTEDLDETVRGTGGFGHTGTV